MQAELVECWLCEATIAPDGALIHYRDEQGRIHPWADRRGRWQPEYTGSRNASVARARSPSWGYALASSPPTDRWYNGSSCLDPQSTQAVVRRTNALLTAVWDDRPDTGAMIRPLRAAAARWSGSAARANPATGLRGRDPTVLQ